MRCGALPAPAPVSVGGGRLARGLARFLALVEQPLQHAHREHEQREEDDQDEARVGHDFVVGRAVEAAAVVVRLGDRCEHECQRRQRDHHAHCQSAHRGHPSRGAPRLPSAAMALLTASDLHKDVAGQPLLRGGSFKLERGERMALAGRNGAGKTTLLRMRAGQASIDRGEVTVAKGVRIALHDQRPPRERRLPLRDYLLSGCAEELQIEGELRELEAVMASGAADEATLARYSRAQARLEARGGYLWRDRATVMARGLGFASEDLDRPLDSFSGGELTRASLARALATGADVLLLDEPTNHLDIDSLEWLEQA